MINLISLINICREHDMKLLGIFLPVFLIIFIGCGNEPPLEPKLENESEGSHAINKKVTTPDNTTGNGFIWSESIYR